MKWFENLSRNVILALGGEPGLLIIIAVILIFFCAFLAFSYFNPLSSRRGRRRGLKLVLCVIVFITLLVTIVFSCAVLITYLAHITTEESIKTETFFSRDLYSLNSGINVSGAGDFTLGSGSFVISTTGCYYYYYQTKNGDIKQGNISADEASIRYITDDSKPRLVGYREIPVVTEKYEGKVTRTYEDKDKAKKYYIIFVPEGSITESFNLN
ncbi:hypothetical protein IKG06_03120 [Candidatus Saccharibacteria bacterium]|nr:hypothetical protein [Candidatus Saccharibacteria bacterium]